MSYELMGSRVEREMDPGVEIVVFKPTGFGFGEGAISVETQLKNPEESGLTPEVLETGLGIIKSGEPFVKVDTDAKDDGCGDGRWTKKIYRVLQAIRHEFKASRRRAKIFGGGLVAATSMFRSAVAGAVGVGSTVLDDRKQVAGLLKDAGIEHGGHTDNHAQGEASGCGAIDKYPLITANALKFRSEITGVLREVYGKSFTEREDDIEAVFASYEDQVKNAQTYFSNATGKKTIDLLETEGSVIKQLADAHLEDFVVINDIEGTTFDQQAFDKALKARGVKGTAQAFVVDSWRGRMYADFIAKTAKETRGIDYQQAYNRAEADFWIRSLAVSGTLTAGDLPVVLRRQVAT